MQDPAHAAEHAAIWPVLCVHELAELIGDADFVVVDIELFEPEPGL
jgi:hypothetical protein